MKYTELSPTEIKEKARKLFDELPGLNNMAGSRVYMKEAVTLIFCLADHLEDQAKLEKLKKRG